MQEAQKLKTVIAVNALLILVNTHTVVYCVENDHSILAAVTTIVCYHLLVKTFQKRALYKRLTHNSFNR